MTTRELFEAWLDAKRLRGHSESTRAHYVYHLECFLLFCDEQQLVPAVWQSRHFSEFASRLALAGHRQTMIHRTMARLATWLRWAYRKGHLMIDLADDLPSGPRPRFQRPATSAEMVRLLGAIDLSTTLGRRDLALLETFYGTGLRRCELLALDLEDLDLVMGLLHVRQGKGAKQRRQPIGDHLAGVLRGYLAETRPELDRTGRGRALFLSLQGRRLSDGGLARLIKVAARQAQVRISTHGFRRAFATHLLEGGAPLRAVQELLGHRSLMATMAYAAITPTELAREHRRTHPRARRRA